MQNGQITLFSLFDGTKVFNIPKYQRAYSWDEKQLLEFVEDFETQLPDKAYFFGTILFRESTREGAFEVIEIVDGQQRITTLMIYMNLILERLKSAKLEVSLQTNTYIRYGGRYKLHVLNEDNLFFENYVLQHNDGSEFIRTPSQRRLLEAHKVLENRVSTYSIEKLQELLNKIDETIVLTYSVADNAEATLIFEMTNDRGKKLTNLEKTKSFLMHKTYLASTDPEHDLEQIQQNFVDIYRDFEEVQEKGVGEDNILQYHFISHEKWWSNNQEKQYIKYVDLVKKKINELFFLPEHAGSMEFINQYTHELRESYGVMNKLLLHPDQYGLLDLAAMNRQATFWPLFIKTFKLDNTENKQQFKRIVRLCEIISFRVWGVRRRRADTGREWLYAMARDFNGDFDRLITYFNNFIIQWSSNNEFQSYLQASRLYEEVSSGDLRYLFWKYENHLRKNEVPYFAEMSFETLMPSDPHLRYSIEHIAPQNPKEAKVVSDASVLPTMTEEFTKTWLHTLGNLTFDPLSANISKSNNPIEEKNQKFFRKAPLKTQNELSDFLSDGRFWDEKSIEKRLKKILIFALDYWNPSKV
jgi:uncharacterized protein with ParB-like and HNH nuclease domain